MGRIMDVFDAEFLDFSEMCGDLDLAAEAKCNQYPPRMVVTRPENLFDEADKAEETKIVITGGLEPEITVKGIFFTAQKGDGCYHPKGRERIEHLSARLCAGSHGV